MGVKVESLIFQVSSPADRGPQELALVEKGLMPVVLFANGPEQPMLLAARPEDVDAAFAVTKDLAEGLGAERLAVRMRVFESLAYAIETDMKYLADPSDFPNDAVMMLVEALYQYGIDDAASIPPCAVRFARDNMQDPDFEAAPDGDMPRPEHA